MEATLTAEEVVNQAWSRGLRPPPALTVSEWAEAHRIVAAPTPWPGPWRNHRTPYLRGIMDWLSPFSAARVVALMKASQVGGTEVGLNWTGFKIHHNPGSMMIVLPDMATTKEWSTLRLARLVETTPCLEGKIRDARERGSGNTILTKQFPGGFLKLTWASSAAKMRSTPAADLLLDEVDAFEGDSEGEGDPVGILKRRFTNFPRGKMFLISTPTSQGGSRIEREFLAGDQRCYFVPCPHCSRFQRLVIGSLKWEKGKPATAQYECSECAAMIGPQHKAQMLARGMWIATAGDEELREKGFQSLLSVRTVQQRMDAAREVSAHLNAAYSPVGCYSWADLADDCIKSAHNVPLLKVFTNTVRGETWRDKGEAPDSRRLYDRREYHQIGVVPAGGLLLILAADIQADRIEVEVAAFGRNRQKWSVYYEVIQPRRQDSQGKYVICRTSEPEPWIRLAELISMEWPCEGGGHVDVMAAGIDTGYNPDPVYNFCARFPQPDHGPTGSKVRSYRTVVPIKGGHSQHKLIEGVSSIDASKARGGLRIVTIGSSYAKQQVYDALRLEAPVDGGEYPPGYYHIPDYEYAYFEGITAETRIVKANGEIVWRKDGRNEQLDLAGYELGAAELCGIRAFGEHEWAELERRIEETRKPVAPVARQARSRDVRFRMDS